MYGLVVDTKEPIALLKYCRSIAAEIVNAVLKYSWFLAAEIVNLVLKYGRFHSAEIKIQY